MNKTQAVTTIEEKFTSMTSEQRTTLWKTIDALGTSEYERGKAEGISQLDHTKPVLRVTGDKDISAK